MFTERKINQFKQKISDLPDTPTLAANELKRRFDACPEELREAFNGMCEDGAALVKRVDTQDGKIQSLALGNFPEGLIHEKNLAPDLATKLNHKAEQSALTAEITARKQLSQVVSKKCELVVGTYTGNGEQTQDIVLGFQAKAVLTAKDGRIFSNNRDSYGALAFPGHPAGKGSLSMLEITPTGFRVGFNNNYFYGNEREQVYYYIAFK